MGDQIIPSGTAAHLPVCVRDALVGNNVLCLNETIHINRLGLESALSTVRPDHITGVLVFNNTGESCTLKNGTLLSKFQDYNKAV